MIHSNSTANHILENWTYANSTSRMAATGFVNADVGKIAYQSDVGVYYRLTATTPVWQSLGPLVNASSSGQALTAATRTYLTGTALRVGQMVALSAYYWSFAVTKTGAGTASSTIDIAVGTNGTTGDTARVSFTKPAGTAVIDEGMYEIWAVVRSVGASGVISGELFFTHNLQTTGFYTQQILLLNTVSSTFANNGNNLYAGICYTSGTGESVTAHDVQSIAYNTA